MKNKTIKNMVVKSFALLMLFVSVNSCEKESTDREEQNTIDFSDFEIDLSKSSFGKEIKVFDYKDKKDLIHKIEKSMHQIISESNDLIKDSETTDVILDITFSGGKAFISSIIEFNSDTNTVISANYFDQKTNAYQKSVPGDSDNLDFARCPEGYTQLASCGNLSNPQRCVSNAVASYLTAEISNIGDCADVRVQVGTFTTRVCGKTC
ncbi:MAG: hypothetical protein AAF611_22175 [Bacteroidota bacterium]